MIDLEGCRIGDVAVRFDGDGVLEFRSSSSCSTGLLFSERKALALLSRVRKALSLSNCLICEPSGGLCIDDDGFATLRLLLPHASPTWLPLDSIDPRIRCQILSRVADQLCDWHSVGVVHRTVSPNFILVDPSPPESANIEGPAVVLLHWACSSIFDITTNSFTIHSILPHRVPSYAAPERLRWGDKSPPSPCEDFYGLGVIAKSCAISERADCTQELNSAPPMETCSANFFLPSEFNKPLTSDRLWHLFLSSTPDSTVLDVFLQPDSFLRAFRPFDLQRLIDLHGSEVFSASSLPLVANRTPKDLNATLSASISETAADFNVASIDWIQNLVIEIMNGKCISASFFQEILKLVVIGVTSKKDIVLFLQKLLQDRVLFKPASWFAYFDIEALKQYDVFAEKSTALMQQYATMESSIQAVLMHMAACPYFIPYHELDRLFQVDAPVSHQALLVSGAVKSAIISGIVCVRLVSEEFAAFVEKQFIKEMLAIDIKILRSLSSRNFPSSHPLGLSLALHTARISARISQDESHLLQYLSDESSTSVSDMMVILLHAAASLNAAPSLCQSVVWNSESLALTGIALKSCFGLKHPTDKCDTAILFHLYCEWHRSIARRLGYKNPDSVSLQDFIPENSVLLLAEAALVEAEPLFLISKFSEASIFVEKAADFMKDAVRRNDKPERSVSIQGQLDRWDSLEGYSASQASSDQVWNLVRMTLIISYSAGRDQIARLLASLTCFDNLPKASFSIGQTKPDIELSALSLLHIASLSDSFKNESSRVGVLSRLTFISEVGAIAQDFLGQILDNSVSFALRALSKIPMSLQFMDNLFWFVLAFFPMKFENDRRTMLSNIFEGHFTPQERASVHDNESSSLSLHHISAVTAMELLCAHYNVFHDNIYRFFAKFWSVVFCVLEGAFVERNLLSAIISLECDAEKSAPAFIRNSIYRLRLILQTSCRISQLSFPSENQMAQLVFDDSDFEAIPLQMQVGLLTCRGMMILQNAIAFNSEYSDTEAADKAALQFFDRAEQVSRLVAPRLVRIGILFGKSFISFRRCKHFREQFERFTVSETSNVIRPTNVRTPSEASLLSQQLLCFSEGLKYFKSLCKLLNVQFPWVRHPSTTDTIGICDYTILDIVAPNSSTIRSFEGMYGFGLIELCLGMMALTDENRDSVSAEYKRVAFRLLLRDHMYHYALLAIETFSHSTVSVDSKSLNNLLRSIVIRSLIGHSDSVFHLLSSPLGWSTVGTHHFSQYQAIQIEESASSQSVFGSIRLMKRCMRLQNVMGQDTVKLHSEFTTLKLRLHSIGAILKLQFDALPAYDKPMLHAVPEGFEENPEAADPEEVLRLLECAASVIACEMSASRIVILRETSSNTRECTLCLNFRPSSAGVDVEIQRPETSSLESNGVSSLVLDFLGKQSADNIFVESFPLESSKTKRPVPGSVSFSFDPIIVSSKVKSIAVMALSIGDGFSRHFIWMENCFVANVFGVDSSMESYPFSLMCVFLHRLKDELLSAIRQVLFREPSKTSSELKAHGQPDVSMGYRLTSSGGQSAPGRKTVTAEVEHGNRVSVSRSTSSKAKPSAFDLMTVGTAAQVEPARHQSDVNFLVTGSKWKLRHVSLEGTDMSYMDKFAKKQHILTISSVSVVSEPNASTISPRAPTDLLLLIEGIFEKKPSFVCLSFSRKADREAWKSSVDLAIENCAEEFKKKSMSTINVCNPTIEDMEPVEMVGKGGFGEVWEYRWGGISLAVKKLSTDLSHKNITLFKQEAELMSKMRHPNILLYISSSLEPPHLYIVTEYMARGSLFNVLHDHSIQLSWYTRVRMALDCASAMLYLHSSDPAIVHRDLKAENLLVSDSWSVKVCDFGLTRFSAQVDTSRGAFGAGSSQQAMTSNIGSTRYCAPEVLGHRGKHIPYTNAVDVHSFGMVLYEMAHRGRRPYWQLNQDFALIRQKIMEGERPKFEDPTAPVEFRDLYRACVNHDPKSRPTFAQISKRLSRLLVSLESEPQEQSSAPASLGGMEARLLRFGVGL